MHASQRSKPILIQSGRSPGRTRPARRRGSLRHRSITRSRSRRRRRGDASRRSKAILTRSGPSPSRMMLARPRIASASYDNTLYLYVLSRVVKNSRCRITKEYIIQLAVGRCEISR